MRQRITAVWAVYREVLTQNNVGTSDNSSLIIIREYSKFNFIACQCTTSQYCYRYYCVITAASRLFTTSPKHYCTLLWPKGVTMIVIILNSRIFAPFVFRKNQTINNDDAQEIKAKTTIKGYAFSRKFNVSTY